MKRVMNGMMGVMMSDFVGEIEVVIPRSSGRSGRSPPVFPALIPAQRPRVLPHCPSWPAFPPSRILANSCTGFLLNGDVYPSGLGYLGCLYDGRGGGERDRNGDGNTFTGK